MSIWNGGSCPPHGKLKPNPIPPTAPLLLLLHPSAPATCLTCAMPIYDVCGVRRSIRMRRDPLLASFGRTISGSGAAASGEPATDAATQLRRFLCVLSGLPAVASLSCARACVRASGCQLTCHMWVPTVHRGKLEPKRDGTERWRPTGQR